MSKFIDYTKNKALRLPKDFDLFMTGDTHVGSRAFHEKAFNAFVKMIVSERRAYWSHSGDVGEGQTVDHKNFNPEGLHPRRLNPKSQIDHYVDLVWPIRKKLLVQVMGNHDRYMSKNFDILEYLMEDKLKIPYAYGHPQTWVKIFDTLVLHFFHGRRSMPKGAKDPIQRRGNRKAWLKRELEGLAGSAHVQAMGHTHYLMSVEPEELAHYTLLNDPEGNDVRAAFFQSPQGMVDTPHGPMPFVPPDARFYCNTGTFRRSGGFGFVDYAEEAGYEPSPIGYILLKVRNRRAVGIEEIVP